MELLYLWVENENQGFFTNQGFNFSPEYDFHMEANQVKNNCWILSENRNWNRRESIFRKKNIENVTAIVGKNGSGKTTLLSTLMKMQETCRQYEYGNGMLYILKEKDIIRIFTNMSYARIENRTDYPYASITEYDWSENFIPMYVTNSQYTQVLNQPQQGMYGIEREVEMHENNEMIRGGFLSPTLMEEYMKSMINSFNKELENLDSENILELFSLLLLQRMMECSTGAYYDLFYLYRILVLEKKHLQIGQVPEMIHIEVIDPKQTLADLMALNNNEEYNKKYERYLKQIETIEKHYIDTDLPAYRYYLNIMLLLCLYLEVDIPMDMDFDSLEVTDEEMLTICDDMMGFLTIFGLEVENREDFSLSYQKEPERYIKFLELFGKGFYEGGFSAALFLKITLPGVSSGERAFRNIVTWLNMALTMDDSQDWKHADTVLLILDEMDLYFHPEWQRKYLNTLMQELNTIFAEYKYQIVCATHSPICLSEIPRENTIYLSGDTNSRRGVVDDRQSHVQTFGKDVYSLLNDAFFLGTSTMGEYAELYINEIIREIKKGDISPKRYNVLENKIDVLGNELVKKKLKQMLNEFSGSRQIRLQQLKAERDRIDQMIKEMER